ncbi:hypothetical protein KY284_010377 [Solanum tuberosum]|nr:hypothetical protein KY284_010377 [Solanum tuberosum]
MDEEILRLLRWSPVVAAGVLLRWLVPATAGRLEADVGQLAAVAGWLLPAGPLLVGRSLVNATTP